MAANATIQGSDPIGQPVDRVDGRAKVTGDARYAADNNLPGLAHAVAFGSTIARGRVTDLDTAAAERSPGVLAVISFKDKPPLRTLSREMKLTGQPGQKVPPLIDDSVHYDGQYLGMVVAETLDQARAAATLVKVEYAPEEPTLDIEHPIGELVVPKKMGRGDPPDGHRGDPDAALPTAAVKVQQVYGTPVEHHNPMELSATVASWDGDRLTLHDSTQHVLGVRSVGAAFLGMNPDDIRVIAPYLGGGFGCKGSVWPHELMAALASQRVRRPVKLVVTRQQMFQQVGYRARTMQKIALGAGRDGKLVATTHDVVAQTSDFDEWVEPSGKQTIMLYSCPNLRMTHRLARVNANTPCQMRAPGEASGTATLEIAMDELAYALNLDPIELRLRNYAERDEGKDKPWSSKALRECYRQGAERFGWSKRNPAPGSMRDGRMLVGMGMATATYPTNRAPSSARVRLLENGRAVVSLAAHDLGTGTYTILSQVASATLGIPVDRIEVQLADTALPEGPVAGGSQTAASCSPAVQAACAALVEKVASLSVADPQSPLSGRDPASIVARDGKLVANDDASKSEPITRAVARNGGRPVEADAQAKPGDEMKQYSPHAWGAQFAEVRVDPELGEVRVARFVGAFAAGTILNAKTARSQVLGGIVWGISLALHEETVYDPKTGRVVNNNLADYLVPVHADIPPIDCFFVEEKEEHVNPLGVKGIGELGITGSAAAVANAVFHATGKRIRDYPIRIEKLLV